VELENIASQSGVNISSVTEATATTASTSDVLKTLNYTISAKTNSYSSLRSTLEKSEQALRILTTTQISANKPNDGAMDLTLNITTFVRGQQ
jgi:septation ring formation regulator EzrA